MFLNFYGLREQPFGVTPNPRYLYHSPAHREALASLIYGIEADLGFATLIAEPGMGKTTLLFYLLEKFRTAARTALIFQTQCTPLDLLRYLASEFELPCDENDPVVLNERIRDLLVQEAQAGRRVVVIIDEAQNLTEDALEAVRLLSDFETPDFKLMHIVLAGQPQLAEKLARPSMAQLLQRISMLNRLGPLPLEEIKNYIEYRLGVAGYRGPSLFTPEALEILARLSGGIPRKINRICFNALSIGCAVEKKIIDAGIMKEVGADLDISDLVQEKKESAEPLDEARHSAPQETPRELPISQPALKARNVSAKLPSTEPIPLRIAAASSDPAMGRIQASGTPRSAPRPVVKAAPMAAAGVQPAASGLPRPAPVSPAAVRKSPPQPTKERKPLVLSGVLGAVILLAGWGIWQKLPVHAGEVRADSTQPQAGSDKALELPAGPDETKSTDEPVPSGSSSTAARNDLKPTPTSLPVEAIRVRPSPQKPKASQSAPPSRQQADSASMQKPPVQQPELAARTRETASNSMMVDFGQNATPVDAPGRPSRGVTPAALLRRVEPIYPPSAQQAGIQGTVIVAAVIAKDGRPRNVRAVSGNTVLAQSAVEAVRKWVYRPYLLDGRPMDVDTQVVISFDLSAANR